MGELMKNSEKTKIQALKWCIAGLILMLVPFIGNYLLLSLNLNEYTNNLIVLIINNLCTTLAIGAFISGAWEALNKKSFAEEILELSQVSDNYIKSGIIHVYEEFTDIDWRKLFKKAKKVVFFFTYGYSWRSNNRTALKMLQEQGTDITVILPNYKDESIIDSLDRNFNYGRYSHGPISENNKTTKTLIIEAKEYFENLGATILLYSGDIKSTYYLIDDKCVIAPFKHGATKISVPAILCQKEGTMFNFCKSDIDALLKESKQEGDSE